MKSFQITIKVQPYPGVAPAPYSGGAKLLLSREEKIDMKKGDASGSYTATIPVSTPYIWGVQIGSKIFLAPETNCHIVLRN